MADERYEDGIFGLIPEDEWLDVGLNLQPSMVSDPLDDLIGDELTDNIVAKWQTIAEEFQTPTMAEFHGFDTEANTAFRIPVDTHQVEKGLIKQKLNQSERLRVLTRSGVREDALYDYILNDGIRLARDVTMRTKVAKNEVLSTGKMTIKENGLDLEIDYGVPSDHKNIKFVINDDTDVSTELQNLVDKASLAGVTINGMVCAKQTLSKLRANKSLQTAINGVYAQGARINNTALDTYLSEEFGINQIITTDEKYGIYKGEKSGRPIIEQKRRFPADVITFFGTSEFVTELGTGLWGVPPEVDLQQFLDVSSSSQPYVYITQWAEHDPSVLWTKASALFIPVIYSPNSLFITKVTEK